MAETNLDKATLLVAYRKMRRHAAAYRDTRGYERAQEAFREAQRKRPGNPVLEAQLHASAWGHVSYARGIEAAASELAELLGIPEHEIDDEEPTPDEG